MNIKSIQLLVTLLLFCCPLSCLATLSCTAPVSTGFSTAYAPTGVVPNVTQGTVTFNCTRTLASDATSVLIRATNGGNANGVQNRAKRGAKFINYEIYQNSACSTVWSSVSLADYITVPLTDVVGAQALTVSYWGCITEANQAVTAGTYTDSVTMRVRNIANTAWLAPNATLTVSIRTPATCLMTTMPGNIAFSYTAFSASAVNANSTFAVNCTLNLPYTMSLDTSSGVVSGLNYALQINSLASPVSHRGTGAVQSHTINGTMPAGQAGTCSSASCIGSQVHTLTITY